MLSEIILLGQPKEVLKKIKSLPTINKENDLEKEKLLEFFQRTGDEGLLNLQRLFTQIAKENNGLIKIKFIEFYYKFLSPSIYKKNQSFLRFLEGLKQKDNFVYKQGKNDKKSVFSFYNKIMEDDDICRENKWRLIKDFLDQKSDNFKDFYNKHKYNYESVTKTYNECGLQSIDDENNKILYKTYPWLENKLLEKIYIGSSKYDIKKYVSKKNNNELIIPIEYEGVDYYVPNDLFFGLISNQRNQRFQDKEDLIFVDRNGKEIISFKILLKSFELNDNSDKRIIQDESIFEKESNYMISLKGMLSEYTVEAFMSSKVEETHFKMAFDYLQKAITLLNPSSKYKEIKMNDEEKSKIKNVRDLLKEIAKITVYLHLDELVDSIFKRRLMLDYYKVDKIFGLSVDERIPELSLLDEDNLNRVKIEKYIDELILAEMFDIGQMMFKIIHHIVGDNLELAKNLGINEIQKVFYPSHNNVAKENVVYYDSEWYDLRELLLGQNTEVYPENDEYFTDIFVPRLCDIFEKEVEPILSLQQHQEKYKNVYKFLDELKVFGIDLSYDEIFFDCPNERKLDVESLLDGGDESLDSEEDEDDVDDKNSNIHESGDNDWDSDSEDDVYVELMRKSQKPYNNNIGDGESNNIFSQSRFSRPTEIKPLSFANKKDFVTEEFRSPLPIEIKPLSFSNKEDFVTEESRSPLPSEIKPLSFSNKKDIDTEESRSPLPSEIKPLSFSNKESKEEQVDVSKFELKKPPQVVVKPPPPVYDYEEIDKFNNNNSVEMVDVLNIDRVSNNNSVEMVDVLNIGTHCDRCQKELKNNGITTYQHSSSDFKNVKNVTMCIECLKNIEIDDF